jgi:hypothetical protein
MNHADFVTWALLFPLVAAAAVHLLRSPGMHTGGIELIPAVLFALVWVGVGAMLW